MQATELRNRVKQGEVVVFQTWDNGRIDLILDANRKFFNNIYLMESERSTVSREVSPGVFEGVYMLRQSPEEGRREKTPIMPSYFIKKILPELKNVLIVVKVPRDGYSLHFPDLPYKSMKNIAVAILTTSIEDIPQNWQTVITRVENAYFASDEEIRAILGSNDEYFRGLTISELKRIATAQTKEERYKLADDVRNTRLRIIGMTPIENVPHIELLALDSYFRRHVNRHLGKLGEKIIITGPPGSGKTFLLKSMAKTFFQNAYILDAGSIMADSDLLYEVLLTLKYMTNVAVVINEFEHLASAAPVFRTTFLNFLEERYPIWFAGSSVNIQQLLTSTEGEIESEMLRPGRINEVLLMPPPFETATKIQIVMDIAKESKIRLDVADVRRLALVSPLLYPSDYLKLIQRYKVEGVRCITQFRDIYNVEVRAESILQTIDLLRALGNTSEDLLSRVENYVLSAIAD
ncbi:MAG: ATP-binding protein [Nitrososphaerota archaeon]